jgi:hypothetical protein
MIGILHHIYYTGFILWVISIPFAIYQGYYMSQKEFKKNMYYYYSNLIIIPPNGVENYTIFTYCCMYCLIYFGISLFVAILFNLFFYLI